MTRTSRILVILLFICVALPTTSPVQAGNVTFSEVANVTASDAAANDHFGISIAVDGDTMVVGAWSAFGSDWLTGAAYVFTRNHGGGDAWQEVAKLVASDAASQAHFGKSVAISGDLIVVSAYSSNQGADHTGSAYIFERNEGGADSWGEVAKLVASDAAEDDRFGESVATDGDTVIVGSKYEDGAGTDYGAAYIFDRNQGGVGSWGEVKKLTGSASTSHSYFGTSVAILNDRAFVGAPNNDLVYVFERNNGGTDNWGESHQITGSLVNNHGFGYAISVSGDTLAVGSHSGVYEGAAWVLERNHGGADNWGEVQRLTASNSSAADFFGLSVSLSDDRLLVGAARIDTAGADAGAAYVFERNAGGADNWGEVQEMYASDAADQDYFGEAVALDGLTVVVGASGNDDDGGGSGSAYVFAACGAGASEWSETAKTIASDGFPNHGYAQDIAFDSGIAVVGAKFDNDLGNSAGAAYILMQNLGGPDNWGEFKKIYPDDGQSELNFGEQVAMSGDTIVFGTQDDDDLGDNAGAVYVFSRNEDGADNWGQVTKLTASDGVAGAWFGFSTGIDNDTIVVGAVYDTGGVGTSAGAAYVFARNHGGSDSWGEVAKLTASDELPGDFFGFSVAVSGDTVAVGAARESTGSIWESGAAYIYSRNYGGADNWGEVAKVKASDADVNDYFGASLDLDNGTLLVGAGSNDDAGFSSGSAYVFGQNMGGIDNWGEVAKLTASDAAAYDQFGSAENVSVDGDIVVIGAYGNDDFGPSSGSVYVFERNAGGADGWGETAKLTPTDATSPHQFGSSTDFHDSTIMIAAGYDAEKGSVYFFDADCPEFDFGDAPDPHFPTLIASDGAHHKLGGTVFLGTTVDKDLNGQSSSDATGDDSDAEGDDEDGVTFTSLVLAGQTAGVDVIASDTCLLSAWVDFNVDGDWDDAGEQIFADEALAVGANPLTFAVPLGTNPGNDAVTRFRVSTAGGLPYDGEATDGEVEDHIVYLDELDYGDAPDPTYPTLLASEGARHVIGGPLFLGTLVDSESDGLPSPEAIGDDQNNLDDEDGVNIPSLLILGVNADIAVTSSTAGLLNAWADFNADGDWTDPGEQIFIDQALAAGSNPLSFAIPTTATTGPLFTRFRLDSTGGLAPTGLALDGEVEDHSTIVVELDYGDAPDPTYKTLRASNGAAHILANDLRLGALVDSDFDGQPTASADGDDTNGADDEDGIVFTTGLGAGLAASADVTASGAGLLNAWIDFNADGDWADVGEQVFTDQALVTGVNSLSFAVPAGSTLGTTFARFRFSTNSGLAPNGYATDGEVEDYMVEIVEGPDLEIDMIASSEPAPSGRPLTYTITVTNNGPLPATSVTVTDTLPGELIIVSSTPGTPDCTLAADTLTCDLGTMAPTNTAQITIETILDHPVWGAFNNTSSVAANEVDPITANNTATIDNRIALFVDDIESGDLSAWD